jgi:hypothetical protein
MEEERRKVTAIVEEQNRRVQEEMESAPNAEASCDVGRSGGRGGAGTAPDT